MTVDHPAGPPGGPGGFRPYAGILSECRDLFERRAGEALARAVAAIDEELQERRQTRAALEESLSLLEAQYQLRALGSGLAQKFHASFAERFRERSDAAAPASAVYGEDSDFMAELSLVDNEQISEELTVQNLAGRLQDKCATDLLELQPRMAFMLGQDEIDAPANPVGPAAVCEALKDVCWAQEGAREIKLMLLDMLVGRLAVELPPVYREINALLVARKVLPRGRPKQRRQGGDRRVARREGESDRRKDNASIIERLFSPAAPAEGSFGAGGGLPLQPDWQTSSGGAELMRVLTRLQQGESSVALGGDAFTIAADAVATTNVLNALLDAGLGKHLGPVDGIVIDVVATLFDFIFDDDRVPEAMKGLIGRLQIPVLKLAMMDHSFFSNRLHPARRLINALAQAAITWDGALMPESSLHKTAEDIVHRIQNEFADNPDVFAACQATLDAYLGELERHADARAATLTDRLEQRERHELARGVARNAIAAHLADDALPASVRGFLADVWLDVLTRAALAGGADGERWRDACATMDELVWSVAPKHGADGRQSLVKRLPSLLKGLRAAMDEAAVADAVREAFFAELVKLHAAALKAGMNPAADTDNAHSPSGPAPYAAADPAVEPEGMLEVDLLARGSWIELKDESGEIRSVRLTWISPGRTMYLFANRQGQRALALTRTELARRFSCAEAVTASDEALVDTALDHYQTPA